MGPEVGDHAPARTLLGPSVAFVLIRARVDQREILLHIRATDPARSPKQTGQIVVAARCLTAYDH
ncbi:hypothetical protein SAMN05660350_02290 [Geodermatophilus obscurus]|uniref:Uncharacterized protein n=1 Tax=Geodermatophilus obscurus TaxID=1861 RepID=A0A1M7TWF8_9ACTN|nr:hypothetical protein [Geodermatophilus obscurus]SHN75069.1 hypothetical protein SAMN05660350_02290 [Geodermatophilus obscurus]